MKNIQVQHTLPQQGRRVKCLTQVQVRHKIRKTRAEVVGKLISCVRRQDGKSMRSKMSRHDRSRVISMAMDRYIEQAVPELSTR